MPYPVPTTNQSAAELKRQIELERERSLRTLAESELAQAQAEIGSLGEQLELAIGHAHGFEALAEERLEHIEAIQASRSYRLMAPLRAILGRRT